MAALWLLLTAWIAGVCFWKAPAYGHIFESLGIRALPVGTEALLAAASLVRQLWFVSVPLLLLPFFLILRGAFDGKSGPFTVIIILALFLIVTLSTLSLFLPVQEIHDKLKSMEGSPVRTSE